jgi:hypothetical protein
LTGLVQKELELVAWNVRGRAEFRIVFIIEMERYTCTPVE